MADGAMISGVRTTCPYCGVGCGVIVDQVEGDGETLRANVRGDHQHPANLGRLCSKGSALGQTLGSANRALFPTINGTRASWDEASAKIADSFAKTIAEHGPESVAFYVSGQILTEDYYVANKLMKGYIGAANIDTNSRLCMASSVAGHKRAFGADIVPGCYEDLEQADLLVLVGSNLAWCHPVLYQRIMAEREKRPSLKIVVIDPRRTATCDFADLHLPLASDSDVPLFLGLLKSLDQRGCTDPQFIAAHTNGAATALAIADEFDSIKVSKRTKIPLKDIETFYTLVAAHEKTVTVYSQGVNQASDGTDRVNAIINCHLLTGRIGKEGSGPFSVTGQPNAMGGREVGGLANMLASHMDIQNPAHRDLVQRFWQSPNIADKAGKKAVDLFEAVHRGEIKAIWIMATNPVVSMPNADRVRAALAKCELVVVSDVVTNSDTAKCADIVLPSTAWGEKQGMVTNSERRMSRQRAFLSAPGEARDDWRQLCDVAAKMGFGDAFAFKSAHEVFLEYAQLCSFENDGKRPLNLSGIENMSAADYDGFVPTQWPASKSEFDQDIRVSRKRMFEDGQFATPDGRAKFVPTPLSAAAQNKADAAFPLVLNTGRVRDHWHTMTRTGKAARLSTHIAEPFVAISAFDALGIGIQNTEVVRVRSAHGQMLARAIISDAQVPGSVFVPIHWTDQFSSHGRVDALTNSDVDPVSGQPALKSSQVVIEGADIGWYGYALVSQRYETNDLPRALSASYWAKATVAEAETKSVPSNSEAVQFELAGPGTLEGAIAQAAQTFQSAFNELSAAPVDILHVEDKGAQKYAIAAFVGDQLLGAVFFAPTPVQVARSWLREQLGQKLEYGARARILAGRPGKGMGDKGAIVCSCMNVGANEIAAAAQAGCASVRAISERTSAGTNCGSCRPEIARFLQTFSQDTVDA